MARVMQNSRNRYSTPNCESQLWRDWLRSDRAANSSWGSSTLADNDSACDLSKDANGDECSAYSYKATAPVPDLIACDESSSNLSTISASCYDEMPEIPFVSCATPAWAGSDRYASRAVIHESSERSFWSTMMRPSASKLSDRSDVVLGHTNDRVFSPSRQRSGSISSNASSRTKPAPAKSILSSSSSIKTKTRRSPPSVKFLDVPEVHYEDEDEDEPYRSFTPIPIQKKSGFLRWIPWTTKKTPCLPERPAISGPFPLSDTPPRRARDTAASLRSVRSKDSLRSVQSHSSRLQSYWGRVTGKGS